MDGPVTSFDIYVGPPNLRFICLGVEGEAELYEVKTQLEGRTAVRRPLRRTLPVEGKWTVDFTDESIFDHLTGAYSDSQM